MRFSSLFLSAVAFYGSDAVPATSSKIVLRAVDPATKPATDPPSLGTSSSGNFSLCFSHCKIIS
jgi:hypothetical protein